MGFEVEVRTVDGAPTAIGSAGPRALVVDRPADAGGSGVGFNGGELLHLAVAACISNDLFREADRLGIVLTRAVVRVDGGFGGQPVASTGITYAVEVEGDAPASELEALVALVDDIAEIPATLRAGASVRRVAG